MLDRLPDYMPPTIKMMRAAALRRPYVDGRRRGKLAADAWWQELVKQEPRLQ